MNHRLDFDMPIGQTKWYGSEGIKRVPGGWIIMFHDQAGDTITSSVFVPYNNEYQQKPHDGWTSVEEALPVIPDAKYGVPVIVQLHDPIWVDEMGRKPDVGEASYVIDKKTGEKSFMWLDQNQEWQPLGDEVYFWRYLPEPRRVHEKS